MKRKHFVAVLLMALSYLLQILIGEFVPALVFTYVGALLLVPVSFPRYLALFLGFFIGLSTDAIYGSWGQHAAASVLLLYVRQFWLNVLYQNHAQQRHFQVTHHHVGRLGLVAYVFSLVFLHHLAWFFIEIMPDVGSVRALRGVLIATAMSTLYGGSFATIVLWLVSVRRSTSPYE